MAEKKPNEMCREISPPRRPRKAATTRPNTPTKRALSRAWATVRSMTDPFGADPPSAFVSEWTRRIAGLLPPPRRALDVAMGGGRHVNVLAACGLRVFGVDKNQEALRTGRARAMALGNTIQVWCADLTVSG